MMPFDDRGLLLGDGLFETILAKDGALVLFDEHIDRMQRGCMALGLPAPEADEARVLCQSMLDGSGLATTRAAVRLTLTAGSGGRGLDRPDSPEPHIFALAFAAPRPEGSVALVTSELRRNEGSASARLKTLSYVDSVLARRVAAPAEALMLNNRGEVACAAAANIFWIRDGRLFTPHRDCGVLDGVMRRQVMAIVGVEEVQAPRAMLESAEAIFLTNSLTGVRPVHRLDGVRMRRHRLVEELAEALAAVS